MTPLRLVVLSLAYAAMCMPRLGRADAVAAARPEAMARAAIEYFFEAGCPECERIKREILPELDRRYSTYCMVAPLDISSETNYLRLVAYQKRFGIRKNEPVSMVVGGTEMLNGFDAISGSLFPAVDRAIAAALDAGPSAPAESPPSDAWGLLGERVRGFTLAGVLAAAAVDSINPCAMATLVFFMSLLSSARMGVRRMLLAGGAFVAACFATYFAIGFGLFRVLYLLVGVSLLRLAVDAVMIAVMAVFAFLSFRDAWRYHRTGRAADVSLKLPAGIERRIHEIMKRGLRKRSLVIGGLGIGAAVTVLESVCTGQVYVPALVLMIKSGQSIWLSAAYLVVYNVIFVLPLAAILGLTCAGLGTPALVDWSRRNVVFSKVLLGLFFAGMIAIIFAIR